jgi:hypothetical protein
VHCGPFIELYSAVLRACETPQLPESTEAEIAFLPETIMYFSPSAWSCLVEKLTLACRAQERGQLSHAMDQYLQNNDDPRSLSVTQPSANANHADTQGNPISLPGGSPPNAGYARTSAQHQMGSVEFTTQCAGTHLGGQQRT